MWRSALHRSHNEIVYIFGAQAAEAFRRRQDYGNSYYVYNPLINVFYGPASMIRALEIESHICNIACLDMNNILLITTKQESTILEDEIVSPMDFYALLRRKAQYRLI